MARQNGLSVIVDLARTKLTERGNLNRSEAVASVYGALS
jgi:hypothetical protein